MSELIWFKCKHCGCTKFRRISMDKLECENCGAQVLVRERPTIYPPKPYREPEYPNYWPWSYPANF